MVFSFVSSSRVSSFVCSSFPFFLSFFLSFFVTRASCVRHGDGVVRTLDENPDRSRQRRNFVFGGGASSSPSARKPPRRSSSSDRSLLLPPPPASSSSSSSSPSYFPTSARRQSSQKYSPSGFVANPKHFQCPPTSLPRSKQPLQSKNAPSAPSALSQTTQGMTDRVTFSALAWRWDRSVGVVSWKTPRPPPAIGRGKTRVSRACMRFVDITPTCQNVKFVARERNP